MKRLVVLTGAGMSAESGISTFRDANGLWENHDVMEVASPEGWKNNPKLVLEFYNQRRRQLKAVQTNTAHLAVAELQNHFEVLVITQNVDNLHERAGSKSILHLHGELTKARSEHQTALSYHWENDLNWGDVAEDGHQLRPDIVWFGESVPNLIPALKLVEWADILIVIGTSLQVYPAASLIHYAPASASKFIIDPACNSYTVPNDFVKLPYTATEGMTYFLTHHLNTLL